MRSPAASTEEHERVAHLKTVQIILAVFVSTVLACSASPSHISVPAGTYGLTAEQFSYVQREAVPGGRLDFEKDLSDDGLSVVDGVAYSKRHLALLIWGQAMKRVGVRDADTAIALYEKVRSVHLNDLERKALRKGFDREQYAAPTTPSSVTASEPLRLELPAGAELPRATPGAVTAPWASI